MRASIVEAQLVDHPEYETFVDAFHSKDDAIQFVVAKFERDADYGSEETIRITQVSDHQVRIEYGLEVYFVTTIELK